MAIPLGAAHGHNSQRSAVLKLGLPAVGEQLLSLMVGLVDTYVVGHLSLAVAAAHGYDRQIALAATGISSQVTWTLITFFMAVALGSTVVIARFVGAGQREQANQTLRQALLIGLAMGGLSLFLAYTFAPQLMDLLGANAQVRHYGAGYLRISALSMPLMALLYVGNAALRGSGDTRTPLKVMLVVNGINAGLSLLLVNGYLGFPAMGINGAAFAAMSGQGIGGLMVLATLIRGRSGLKLDQLPRPNGNLIWRILRQGLPYGAEQFIFQAALLIFIHLINDIGTAAYAAHNTIITIESISFLPGMGLAVAATTLVGQHMGANQPQQASESGFEAFRLGALFMGIIGLLFVLVPEVLLRFFVADEEVVQLAALPLRMVGFAQPALAANFIFSGSLRGGGEPKWPLISKMLSVWCVRLPLAWLLVKQFNLGLNGIWLAMCTDFAVQGTLAWWRFRQGKWQHAKV